MTVGLTGTREFQQKLGEALSRLGIESVSLMEGISSPLPVEIPWDTLAGSWIVFSSARGVDFFFDRAEQEGVNADAFAGCRFAVIGGETRKAAERRGFPVTLCPEEYHSRALTKDMLAAVTPEDRAFLFCSKQGSDHLQRALAQAGVQVFRYDIYDTVFRCRADAPEVDYVAFGSGAGVRNFRAERAALGRAIPVCIGPICADACRECFGVEPLMAEQCTVESMAALLQRLSLTNV